MRFAPAVAFACMCATLGALEQDRGAPLAEAKQQLQTLRQDQGARDGTEKLGDSLRGAVPQVAVPGPAVTEAAKPPRPPPERTSGEAADQARNWLVDGYERLGPTRSTDRRRGSPRAGAEENPPLDPKDPDYFLRLYERQRVESQALAQGTRDRAQGLNADAPANAMAPFLQEWLAGSPVKSVLADVLRPTSEPGSSAEPTLRDPRGVGGRTAEADRSGNLGPQGIAAEPMTWSPPARNPYLAALEIAPPQRDSRGTALAAAPVPPSSGPANARQPEGISPKGGSKAPSDFVPPPSPQDEKKYFPQLKKF